MRLNFFITYFLKYFLKFIFQYQWAKKSIHLIIFSFFLFCNTRVFSQQTPKITIIENNAPLEKVLKDIRKQTTYDLIYNFPLTTNSNPVNLNLKGVELKIVLDSVFRNQPYKYSIQNNTIIIFPISQNNSIVNDHGIKQFLGIIKDTIGNGIQGVSVLNINTKRGTSSNSNGEFTIKGNSGDQLLISSIGYQKQDIILRAETLIIITLKEINNQLEPVVVTALGVSKNETKIGYGITKVDGNLLNISKEPNIANNLIGRVSGLNVSSTSAGPGSSSRLLIRGISNLTSETGPLLVLDGVPIDNTQKGSFGVYSKNDLGDGISSINPDDIENIVVLKGSTASALYGSRASNGVIQITTKSGKGSNGFSLEYVGNYSINSIIDNTDYQKVYGAGQNGLRPQNANDLTRDGLNSWGNILDGSPSIAQDGHLHPYSPVPNQLEKFYRIGPITNNTISLINGEKSSNMRLSISQLDNESIIPNSNLVRYTTNLNLTRNITSKIEATIHINFINENVKNRPALSDMSRNPNFTLALLPSNIDPNYLTPGYNSLNGYENALSSDGYITNPWFAAYKDVTNTSRNRLVILSLFKYNMFEKLNFQARIGLDRIEDALFELEPTGQGFINSGALDAQSNSVTSELNTDFLLNYSFNISKDYTFTTYLGLNIRKYSFENSGISGFSFKVPFLYTSSNLTNINPIYDFSKKQTNSEYYSVDFSCGKFITLSTTGRYDVFSTLPSNNRGLFTPSFSGSFLFSRLIDLPGLNYGKLRTSFAQTSGEAIPYQTSTYYQIQPGTIDGLPFGNTLSLTSNVGNLRPYRLLEYEIGLELKGLDSRINLDLDYFNRRTKNELIGAALSISSGYNFTYVPLGSTLNTGFELTLNCLAIKTTNLSWNSNFNLTIINNKLINIDGKTNSLRPPGVGESGISSGVFNAGQAIGVTDIVGLPLEQIMGYDYKYDNKGNLITMGGIPERGQLIAMGTALPKFYGGWNNDFNYKQFSFSFLLDYRFGSKLLSQTNFLSIYYGLNKLTLPGRETGIIIKGVNENGSLNTTILSAQAYYQGLAQNITSLSIFDSSFIKLRELVVGYQLKSEKLTNTPFKVIKFAITCRNLITLLKYTNNFDPEDSFSSLPGNAGLEGGGLPSTRTIGINLNIKLK